MKKQDKVMSLKDNILDLQKQAMKAGEKEKLSTLRLLLSDIKNVEINERRELTDEDVLKVIGTQVKKLKDAMKDFQNANRNDLIENTERELKLLESFLPEQMNDDDLKKIVKEVIDEIKPDGKKDFGRVMGTVMARVSGKADGNRVKDAVNEFLT
ncbi:MAG: GatB/YqeY domain-containing protein [bacterium]